MFTIIDPFLACGQHQQMKQMPLHCGYHSSFQQQKQEQCHVNSQRKQHQLNRDAFYRQKIEELARQRLSTALGPSVKQKHSPKATYPGEWRVFPTSQCDEDVDYCIGGDPIVEYDWQRSPTPTRHIPIKFIGEEDEKSAAVCENSFCEEGDVMMQDARDAGVTIALPESYSAHHVISAIKIQIWFREILKTRSYMKSIMTLVSQFNSEFPAEDWKSLVESACSSLRVDTETGKLTVGAKENRKIVEVEESLTGYLLRADSIESGGMATVREQRKCFILAVQGRLNDIETATQILIERARMERQLDSEYDVVEAEDVCDDVAVNDIGVMVDAISD